MQPEFWRERWCRGLIGFHKSTVERYLDEQWTTLGLASDCRIFVPLCGKSLDLLWLRDRGHEVLGVELSAIALQAFCMENGVPARRRTLPDFDLYEAPGLALLCGDFFSLTTPLLSDIAAVYDRAALISWAPDLRAAYVEKMTAITRPGTQTLLITLEFPPAQMNGPPFSVDTAEVERLYLPDHTVRELDRRDVLASEPRLQARGLTQLTEVCYRLTRR